VEHLAGPLIVIAVFAWLAIDNWTNNRAATARNKLELEERKLALEAQKMEFEAQKLFLEKCQSTEEVKEFLATDAGKRFVERMIGIGVAPPTVSANPLLGIIALVVFGALGTGLGLAFFLLSKLTTHTVLIIPAFLVAVPGLGLLIGAAVSYHLKKKWGLLKREPAAPVV
jgi:hypothetical protein